MEYIVKCEGNGLASVNHKERTITLGSSFLKLPEIERKIVFYHEIWHVKDEERTFNLKDEIEADVYAIERIAKEHKLPNLVIYKRLVTLLRGENGEHKLRLQKVKEEIS